MVSARILSNLRLRAMLSDGIGLGNKLVVVRRHRFVGTSTSPRQAFS